METGAERPQFTPRERQVLDELVRGRTNYEIAQRLGISLDGVKWHIREILSKLGVASREDAAEYWVRQRGWRRAARGAGRGVGVLFGLRTGLTVVGAAVVGGGVLGAWLLLRPADDAALVDAAITAAPGPAPTPTVRPPDFVFQPLQAVVEDGALVPLTCDVSYPARRPTLAEIKGSSPLWVRFNDRDGRLFTSLFALSLSSAYYNILPRASSAGIEPGTFFRSLPTSGDAVRCSPPMFDPAIGLIDDVQTISLRDYRPIELRISGDGAVLTVASDPGIRHEVAFLRPTVPEKGAPAPKPFAFLKIVDETGHERMSSPFGSWWELDATGRVVVVQVANAAGASTLVVPLRGVAQQLRVVAGGTHDVPGSAGATIEIRDGNGAVLERLAAPGKPHAWDEIAIIDVPAGATEMRVSVPADNVGGIMIVPVETELPVDGRP